MITYIGHMKFTRQNLICMLVFFLFGIGILYHIGEKRSCLDSPLPEPKKARTSRSELLSSICMC